MLSRAILRAALAGWLRRRTGPGRGLRRRFAGDEDGLAILEFALILPVLLMTYIGTIEVSNMMGTLRKLDLFTQTVGDFAGSVAVASRAEIDGMFAASKVVVQPLDDSGITIVVSAVGVLGTVPSGVMRVCSSVAGANATARPVGDTPAVALPADQRVGGARMLLVETRMPYRPIAGSTFTALFGQVLSNIVFSRQIYWPVRVGLRYHSQAPEVVLPGGGPCPAS
ncbi:hypothetical protein ASG40_15495 [Methylobacterium sp. Leaf399]|uniref:TadE/TadG family type IV pilus assembly protein n=1 Tax=unclassified Methylobacterium TaxID=2615210 RepID=UPI0006FF167D|nr:MULTISPECIES: TadE/TadG family type IV pilus assembly protein [unclassified Methylobacterium]KQP58761.1 hypothetical protein ASF39_17300 [Methylobacterium sp. Leaf108]KQT19063.1 hypothetical protein ASG40_15495 [Methylobacterium sp. Leaf399]KQT85711.1 hypothetical protein ASG59_17845 [Methylobacterium sp. Leaf466]